MLFILSSSVNYSKSCTSLSWYTSRRLDYIQKWEVKVISANEKSGCLDNKKRYIGNLFCYFECTLD